MFQTLLRRLLRVALVLSLVWLSVLPIHARPVPRTPERAAGSIPQNLSEAESQYLLLKLSLRDWADSERALPSYGLSNWTRLRVPGWVRVTVPGAQAGELAASFQDDPGVLAVELDGRMRMAHSPNDALWNHQWGPRQVRVPEVWEITSGRPDIVVAVLDTGIDLYHADLDGQLWTNPGEVPGNEVDDDGNGYVDDVHGWRFLHDATGKQDQSAQIADDHGHGTHVSGIIAARGDNRIGIAGMAWGCRLMVVKVLDHEGDGYYSDLADGLVYAVDSGARIANLSLSGPEPSQIVREAVDYAHSRGMLIVAAAGNSNSEIQYPAALANTMAVAASDSLDQVSTFSCQGPEMSVAAPGSGIYSTCRGSGYCYKSGTSMAVPHVAGLAALIWSVYPDYSPAQVTQRLEQSAQDIGDPGWDPEAGWGRVDALNALVPLWGAYRLYFPKLGGGPHRP
jgi:subtilisin family serine protease